MSGPWHTRGHLPPLVPPQAVLERHGERAGRGILANDPADPRSRAAD